MSKIRQALHQGDRLGHRVHTQYDSGTSVRWAKGPQYAATRGAKPTPLCLATRVSITGYAMKKSGYTSGSFIRNMKACVKG
jgi:hypothetical protein